MNQSMPLIRMQQIVKRYPHFLMQNFNLELNAGEVLGVIGPNGAGKTTLLQLMMGFTQADEGTVEVLGLPVEQQQVAIKQQVAYVAEDMRLFGQQTIGWHMKFMQRIFTQWDAIYAENLACSFQLNKAQRVNQLSLGQRIKTTLMLALARRPKVLVLDEPSTGLDPVARHELTSQLFQVMLNEENSVVFSSQFTQDVERLSDRIMFIDDGSVISDMDKEAYLDKWRRVEIPLTAKACLASFDDIAGCDNYVHSMVVTHSNFTTNTLQKYRESGVSVTPQPMSLEEIFIAQTLYQRSLRGEQHA